MMSKNSFLINAIENGKRRIWILAISILLFLFYFPVGIAVSINSAVKRQEIYPQIGFQLKNVYINHLSFNQIIGFITVVLAVLIAIQGFSYLFSRKKMDLYASIPVSKEKRFLIIYTNGILLYVIPYLIHLLVSFIIIGAYDRLDASIFGTAFAGFGINFLLFLGVYHVVLIAVMLTAHTIVCILASFVLLIYEYAVRLVSNALCQVFLYTYSGFSEEKLQVCIGSPIFQYAKLLEHNISNKDIIMNVLGLLLMVVVFGIIAFLLYQFRPSEANERAIAYLRIKPYIKVLLMIPMSLAGAILFYSVSGESIGLAILGLVLSVIISHCLIEIIYDFDMRSIWKNKKAVLISGFVAGLILAIFNFDSLGYNAYIPNASKVKAIALSIDSIDYYTNFYDEDGQYIDKTQYRLQNMKLTDIEKVLELVGQRESKEELEKNEQASMRSRKNVKEYVYMNVKYTLNSGREVYRNIPISIKDNIDLIDELFTQKEYKRAAYQIFDEKTSYDPISTEVQYSNGISLEKMDSHFTDEFMKIYRQEFYGLSFQEIYHDLPVGGIVITQKRYDKQKNSYYLEWNYPVYPSFTKTIQYLKDNGIFTEWIIYPEDVKEITITNYNSDYQYDMVQNYYKDTTVETTITDLGETEQVLGAILPEGLSQYVNCGQQIDYNYLVDIEFKGKANTNISSRYGFRFWLLDDKIPEFVKERTVYKRID